jgi:hypothetical protein
MTNGIKEHDSCDWKKLTVPRRPHTVDPTAKFNIANNAHTFIYFLFFFLSNIKGCCYGTETRQSPSFNQQHKHAIGDRMQWGQQIQKRSQAGLVWMHESPAAGKVFVVHGS